MRKRDASHWSHARCDPGERGRPVGIDICHDAGRTRAPPAQVTELGPHVAWWMWREPPVLYSLYDVVCDDAVFG